MRELYSSTLKKLEIIKSAERGVTLIEALIALALLGIVAAAIPSGVATAYRVTYIADERTTMQSLAISQMEMVKSSDYIDYNDPDHGSYELVSVPDGYLVTVQVLPMDPVTGEPLPADEDQGLQKIIAAVVHYGDTDITYENYKVNR